MKVRAGGRHRVQTVSSSSSSRVEEAPCATGMENGITFTGCSCVMSLKEPRVLAALGPKDVGVIVQELEVPTAAQLAKSRRETQLA